jgi:hypothetical protein
MAETKSSLRAFWSFIRQQGNRAILSWAAGGLVALAGAMWAVFVYLAPPNKSPTGAHADCGAVAAGRDISGSSVSAGNCTQNPK